MRVTFGEFVFDTDDRELRRGSKHLDVSPRALQVLAVLLRARPRVLSKLELLKELRPAGPVSEARLSNLIAELRGALGENPRNARFIKTIRGYGYAFTDGGDTPTLPPRGAPRPTAHLTWETDQVTLQTGVYVLGRGAEADVEIDSGTVSRRHARLTVGRGPVRLEDLGSTNGTWVDGDSIDRPVELRDGDSFILGSVEIRLALAPADPKRST